MFRGCESNKFLLAAFTAISLSFALQGNTPVFADDVANMNIRPSWIASDGCTIVPNASFLAARMTGDDQGKLLGTTIINQKYSNAMMQEYNDRTRDYEMRSNYGLTDMASTAAYGTQTQPYTDNMSSAVKTGQISAPVAYTGSVASFYFGNALDTHLNDDTRLWARADVPNQTGEVKVWSPIVNSSMSVDNSDYAKMALGAGGQPARDPSGNIHERYRMAVNRGLSIWDFSSELSYGATSSTVHAALSKPIVGNLTGIVESVHPAGAALQAGAPPEQIVRLAYGITF
jgi:hypothetical protein